MNYCQPTCQEVVPMVNHARRTCTQDNNKDDEHLGMAGRLFWDWALNKTLARAQTEGWTPRDCTAALMQSPLLSYTLAPGNVQLYGNRHSPTCPDDFLHILYSTNQRNRTQQIGTILTFASVPPRK